MFRFNHPKEAAKLREKRKSGLLSSFSLSMTDLSKSCENLSAVMLYNPGLEFERQQREELEKLESKRKLIEEMEEKQKSDKAELERMQQEVETQRKETEIVQLQIRKQEESLKRRSFHIESRLKDLLAEKEKFEEERQREQQEIELQKKKQEEESFLRVKEELQRLQELNNNEKAEKIQIFRELDRLKREKDEQCAKLELEKKRLEEQEKEQLMLAVHLEEQLREKQEMIRLLRRGEVQRVEEERRDLEGIREALLRAKEARAEGDDDGEELERAQLHFLEFKRRQLVKLANLEKDLIQQKDLLKKEVEEERELLEGLKSANESGFRSLEGDDNGVPDVRQAAQTLEQIKPAEYRLQYKERQLQYLLQQHLPTLLEEKQRAFEILDRGPLGLDNTLYQVEKEMEEKDEQLAQYEASASQLQKLQATFEFTANIARQEEKVRRKEKEILESREKQQREALERAVARLERRHSALQRRSTLGLEIEEQRQKLATLNGSSEVQSGLRASLEAEQEALEKDRERLEHEIQQLKQKICEVDGDQKGHHGTVEGKTPSSSLPSSAEKSHLVTLMDARISAYIEEEVQRRLQDLRHVIGEDSSASAEVARDNEKLHNGTIQRKLKYEKRYLAPLLPREVTDASSREEGREVDLNDHPGPPTAHSISASPAPSSASRKGAHQRRHQPSGHEVWQNSDHGYGHPDCAGHFQPNRFSLPESAFLNKSSTSDIKQQRRAGHFSELMTHKEEHSLRIESSWSLLQDLSQEAPLPNGSDQTRQSKLFCLVLSETVSSEDGASHGVPQDAPTRKFCGEQQVNKELDAKKVGSPQSLANVRTEGNSGPGSFYHRLADLYKDTSSHLLQAGTEVIRQAGHVGGLYDPRGLTSHMMTFIRRLPFLKHFTLDTPLKSCMVSSEPHALPREAQAGSSDGGEAGAARLAESVVPFRAPGLTATSAAAGSPSSVWCLGCEDSRRISAFKQTLVQFPAPMLKLQELPLKDFLEHMAHSVPELLGDVKEARGVYWLAVANCTKPEPQPACLLLLPFMLCALVLSDSPPGSVGVFHALPLSGLKEIQISFGGQSIRFLSSAESLLLTVFSYDKTLCQQICHDLLCVLMPESEASIHTNHPLLQQDLVQFSLDWKAEIPDLVLADGVRLSSRFQDTLVDMIYFLHGNMEVNIPSLAEVQLLLYITVRVESDPGRDSLQSLVLLNTHIALLREDQVFYPRAQCLNTLPPRTRFDVTRCRALSEFRYIVVPEKNTLSTIRLVFSEKLRLPSDSRNSPAEHFEEAQNIHLFPGMLCPVGSQNGAPEVWKLTLSSQDEALWLITHLTKLSGGNL